MASLRAKGRKDFQREWLNPAMGMSKMKKILSFLQGVRDFAFSMVRSRGDSRGLPSEILLRGSANQVAGGKVDQGRYIMALVRNGHT